MLAVVLADALEAAGLGPIPLLVGFVLVTALLDIIIPGVIPKWAIFAPIFIPLFLRLGIAPQLVLAAYRVGDSPFNVITPLMAYFAVIVVFAQRYEKTAGCRHDRLADDPVLVVILSGLDRLPRRLVRPRHPARTGIAGLSLMSPATGRPPASARSGRERRGDHVRDPASRSSSRSSRTGSRSGSSRSGPPWRSTSRASST